MNNWNRKDLKAKAKLTFKANYWKCVLVAVLIGLFAGSSSTGVFTGAINGANLAPRTSGGYTVDYDPSGDNPQSIDDPQSAIENIFENDIVADSQEAIDNDLALAFAGLIGIILVVALIAIIIGILVTVFFGNPLLVGLRGFFVKNARSKAELSSIMQNFDKGYMNTVKTMFFMDLKLIGWTLLLIIPGIIKSYEYRMIPYILADNPDMDRAEAHAKSKEMMMGNKWRAFVLDLSFIGWFFLSGITLGLVGLFYVSPYYYQTDANLYEALNGNQLAAPAAPETVVEPVEVDFVN